MLNHLKPINSIFVLGHKIDKKHSENASDTDKVTRPSLFKQKSEN